jgi:hypothetical protein
MPADVARLRFIMSADAGGIRSGCKEAAGSLKEMAGETGRTMREGNVFESLERGLHSQKKTLRFAGHELGREIGGGLHKGIEVAEMGLAMGPAGLALGAGMLAVGSLREREEEMAKQRTESLRQVREAQGHGISVESYRNIAELAGQDTKYLDDMADAMKRLGDAGPGGAKALEAMNEQIAKERTYAGIPAETSEAGRSFLARAGEEKMKEAGITHGYSYSGHDQILAMQQHFTEKYKEQGMSQEQAEAKANQRISAYAERNMFGGGMTWKGWRADDAAYERDMAEYMKNVGEHEKKAREDAALKRQGGEEAKGLRTNREKLDDRLKEIEKIRGAGGYDLSDAAHNEQIAGRATQEALEAYRKAQGGAVGMAAAMTAGSVGAYGVVAQAQMGAAAEDSTAQTNALLEQHFPELIAAVKALQPHWREADGPT